MEIPDAVSGCEARGEVFISLGHEIPVVEIARPPLKALSHISGLRGVVFRIVDKLAERFCRGEKPAVSSENFPIKIDVICEHRGATAHCAQQRRVCAPYRMPVGIGKGVGVQLIQLWLIPEPSEQSDPLI